jgi:hypothetical protein
VYQSIKGSEDKPGFGTATDMIDKFPMAAAAGSEFLSIKPPEKPAPGGEILPALHCRNLERDH